MRLKYGVSAILTSGLLFISLFLPAMIVRFVGLAGNRPSFFNILGEIGNNNAIGVMIGILTVFTLIAVIMLAIIGVCIITRYMQVRAMKAFKTIMMSTGMVAILTAIVTIIDMFTTETIPGMTVSVGVGTILLLVFGIFAMSAPFVLKMIKGEAQ